MSEQTHQAEKRGKDSSGRKLHPQVQRNEKDKFLELSLCWGWVGEGWVVQTMCHYPKLPLYPETKRNGLCRKISTHHWEFVRAPTAYTKHYVRCVQSQIWKEHNNNTINSNQKTTFISKIPRGIRPSEMDSMFSLTVRFPDKDLLHSKMGLEKYVSIWLK